MLRGTNLNLNPSLTDKFFTKPKPATEIQIYIDGTSSSGKTMGKEEIGDKESGGLETKKLLPLPSSPEKLKEFLASDDGKLYKSIFVKYVNEINEWAKENKIDTAHWEMFRARHLSYEGGNANDPEFYTIFKYGIAALAGISAILRTPAKDEKQLEDRKNAISNLFETCHKCPPGVYTYLNNTYVVLTANNNLDNKISALRQEIILEFINELLQPFKVSPGLDVHYVNAIRNYHAKALGLDEIEDPYIDKFCNRDILEKLNQSFSEKISEHLSLQNFINHIIDRDIFLSNFALRLNNRNTSAGAVNYFQNLLSIYQLGETASIYKLISEIVEEDKNDEYQSTFKSRFLLEIYLLLKLMHDGFVNKSMQAHEALPDSDSVIHYFPEQSLHLAYIDYIDKNETKQIPFIVFFKDALLGADNKLTESLITFIDKHNFHEQQRYELVKALVQFTNSFEFNELSLQQQQEYFTNLTQVSIKLLPNIAQFLDLIKQNKNEEINKSLVRKVEELAKENLIDSIKTQDQLKSFFSSYHLFSETTREDLLKKSLNSPHFYDENISDPRILAVQVGNLQILKDLDKLKQSFKSIQFYDANKRGETLLMIAAQRGYKDIVEYILTDKKYPYIDNVDPRSQMTALMMASRNGHVDIVNMLKNRSNLNLSTGNGQTAMMLAIQHRHIDVVKILLPNELSQLNFKKDRRGFTALHLAAEAGDPAIVGLLLEHKADPNQQTAETNYSALMIACIFTHLSVVRELLKSNKTDINAKDFLNKTALMYAVEIGSIDIVRELINHNADLTVSNLDNESALIIAIKNNEMNIVKLILENLAKPDLTAAVQLAKSSNNQEMLRILDLFPMFSSFKKEEKDSSRYQTMLRMKDIFEKTIVGDETYNIALSNFKRIELYHQQLLGIIDELPKNSTERRDLQKILKNAYDAFCQNPTDEKKIIGAKLIDQLQTDLEKMHERLKILELQTKSSASTRFVSLFRKTPATKMGEIIKSLRPSMS